jgi:bifunctional non-homologous end joining protein LigD
MMAAKNSGHTFGEREYGFKKHDATRLHYDLRLEWNGVLLSWVLPDGPSYRVGVERNAIEMPDHRKKYLSFEGVHETGTIMLWDRGIWAPDPNSEDIESSLRRGILQFTLHGEKLEGRWMLARTNSARNSTRPIWTLCKQIDSFAGKYVDMCVLKEQPNSVATGRTMEEIVRDWTRPKDKYKLQTKLFIET